MNEHDFAFTDPHEDAFRMDRRSLLRGAMAAALAGTLLPEMGFAQQAVDKSTLAIAYPVDVSSWDPNAMSVPAHQPIYATVFDSPLRFSPKLKLEQRQVKEWKWVDDKAQRLEITLRDDIYFHDGSKLTMEDVRYSLSERGKADKKLVVAGMFNTLADIEVVSPTKGVMVFNRPSPAAAIYLGFLTAYVVPKAYLTKVGIEAFNEKPIGAGPYRVVEHQRGSRIVLEAFDKYWGHKPAIKNIIFQITPEASARVALIESGRVGMATQLPLREVQRLSQKPGITTKVYPYSEVYMLRVPSYAPGMENDHVRAAMHLAIDTAALSKAFYGGVAKPISVMTAEGTPADVPDFKFPFDKAKAAAELKAAGYGTDKPFNITLATTNGVFPSDFDMARAIAQMWKAVGFNVTIEESTTAKLIEAAQNGKLPGPLLYNWANSTGDPENYIGRILDPRLRFSAWKDMSLATRIDGLMTEVDEAKRIAGYKALNVESSEKSWAVPLLQAVTTVAYTSMLNPTLFDSGYIIPADYSYR